MSASVGGADYGETAPKLREGGSSQGGAAAFDVAQAALSEVEERGRSPPAELPRHERSEVPERTERSLAKCFSGGAELRE